MNFNEVTAGLSLIANSIKHLEIQNSISEYNNEMSKSFGLNVVSVNSDTIESRKFGTITLEIDVDVMDSDDNQCKISLEVEGKFLAKSEMPDEQFTRMLYINGVSALIGIARGKIEAITANSFNSGKITIPFVNVMDYYSEMINSSN